MPEIYKTSNAYIKPSASDMPIWIVEACNPEKLIPEKLKEFILEFDFSELYPNFKTVRIGAVHPFALLLFQEVMGQTLNTDVFPSITVSDSSETESFETMGRELTQISMTPADVAEMDGHRAAGRLIVSDSNWARVQAAVASKNLAGTMYTYMGQHNIDINIWSDNKDITSLLYDLIKQFFTVRKGQLHEAGFDIQAAISGRRSGDISMEFGMLLYGANITVPCVIKAPAMLIEVVSTEVGSVVVGTPGGVSLSDPGGDIDYHTEEV